MKKYLYPLVIGLICALTVVSCTEEQVTPKTPIDAPGGSGSTGKI